MDENKKSAIVFSVTSDLIFAVASVLMDIKKICRVLPDEVVVFHDGVNKKNIRLLNDIMPVKGVRYSLPANIEDAIDIGTLCYFSKMIFAKFECLNLLNEYDTVLFLDYDQVINKDISSLYSPENRNIIMLESDGNLRKQLYSPIPGWDMEINAYCASVMSFSRSIGDYNKMYSWCNERAREYSQFLYIPDQAIYAMLFDYFSVVPETIRLDQYCCHPSNTKKIEKAFIIHAYGKSKFWNGIKNQQWNENYERWKKMGGDPYKEKSNKRRARIVSAKIRNKIRLFINRLTKVALSGSGAVW